MMLLWCSFNGSGSVLANTNWRSLLISASKVHQGVHLTAAGLSGWLSEMYGALYTLHILLNNACTWTAHRWLRTNDGHVTVQIWIPWTGDNVSDEWCIKLLWMFYSKPKTVSELKGRTEEDMRTYLQIQFTRLSPVFGTRLKEYTKADGRHFKHLL